MKNGKCFLQSPRCQSFQPVENFKNYKIIEIIEILNLSRELKLILLLDLHVQSSQMNQICMLLE